MRKTKSNKLWKREWNEWRSRKYSNRLEVISTPDVSLSERQFALRTFLLQTILNVYEGKKLDNFSLERVTPIEMIPITFAHKIHTWKINGFCGQSWVAKISI